MVLGVNITIGIDIDMVILENIDINIDIDMDFLRNIDINIEKGILKNMDIDKVLYRLEFGILNRANPPQVGYSAPQIADCGPHISSTTRLQGQFIVVI